MSPSCRYSTDTPSLNFLRPDSGQMRRHTTMPQMIPIVTAKKRWKTISKMSGLASSSRSSSSPSYMSRARLYE